MKKESLKSSIIRSKLMIFLAIAIVSGVISVIALRNNYSTMVRLRENVVAADQKNGDVESALRALREHVYGHMNTNLSSGANPIKPPIQLKGRYDRLMAVEKEKSKAINVEVEAQAKTVCNQQYPSGFFNPARVACVSQYISDHAVKENGVDESLYKFDFISPRWSPDLAGISLLIAITSGLILILGVGIKIVKRRYF